MKKLISILLSFSIIFTGISQSRKCAVYAGVPTATPTPMSSGQSIKLDDIGIFSLLWRLIFKVVSGGRLILKFVKGSYSCGQRLLGVLDEVLFGVDQDKRVKEEIKQMEKCFENEECQKILRKILNEGATWSNKKELEEVYKKLVIER